MSSQSYKKICDNYTELFQLLKEGIYYKQLTFQIHKYINSELNNYINSMLELWLKNAI